jgi:SAM-dependent methyltransferase
MVAVPVFDQLADRYDETRGGERRGEDYAAAVDGLLTRPGPVLELGVGTGVVGLGLVRRGRQVVRVDVSPAMLARARGRLGPVVVQADACALPLGTGSFHQALAVWMVHAVTDPHLLFAEAARVLAPAGRLVACPSNRTAPGDAAGAAFDLMVRRLRRLEGPDARPEATAATILAVARAHGFDGAVHPLPVRRWVSSRQHEIDMITDRTWSALLPLDDATFAEVTDETLARLRALPDGPIERRVLNDVVVLNKTGRGP